MTNLPEKPIAVCRENDVWAYDYPFFIKPASDFEPPFLFLDIHLENFGPEDDYILRNLVKIESESDLCSLGFNPAEDGIYYI